MRRRHPRPHLRPHRHRRRCCPPDHPYLHQWRPARQKPDPGHRHARSQHQPSLPAGPSLQQ